MDGDRNCQTTLQLKRGDKRKVICQEAASDVRSIEVTAELSQHYVARCLVSKTKRGRSL
jgi:hypothetical protein